MEHTCGGMHDITCEACWALGNIPISDEERDKGLSAEEVDQLYREIGGEG